jgi:transposase
MNLHLAEIGTMVTPGKHAVLLLDQAGWHLAAEVAVPSNITLVPLPPKCPGLNVMQNVWQFVRDNWTPPTTPPWRRADAGSWLRLTWWWC